jgi:GDSL-like lipase/acylhydrolase family protein
MIDTDASASPPRRPPTIVRLVAGTVFGLLFGALALLVLELSLQTANAWTIYQEVRRHPPHPFLQVLPAMSVDHVNTAGFRGDEIAVVKPHGAIRIITVGGSTTLGVTNAYVDTYPYLMQTLLRERHPNTAIEVVNAGAPWYTTAHDLVAYEVEVRRYQPDVVIFFEAINDLTRSFSPPWFANGDYKPDYSHYLGPYSRLQGPDIGFLGHSSSLLTWNIVRRWVQGGPNPFDIRHPENVAKVAATMHADDKPAFRSIGSFREYYDAVIHAVQSDGHLILTASQPFLYRPDLSADDQRLLYFAPLMCADRGSYPSQAAMERGMRLYNDAAREIAAQRNVPFLDFESAVPKTGEYFSDDVHMRKAANAILAKIAADGVEGTGVFSTDRAR